MQTGISVVGFVVGYSTFTEVVCCCAKRNLDTFMLFNLKLFKVNLLVITVEYIK
jgi:hypothetical protein